MTDPAAPSPTDLMSTLQEMRASVAAQGARKGLAGTLQEAILRFLEVIMALLLDLRAGRLAPVPECAAAAPATDRPANEPSGSAGHHPSPSRSARPSRRRRAKVHNTAAASARPPCRTACSTVHITRREEAASPLPPSGNHRRNHHKSRARDGPVQKTGPERSAPSRAQIVTITK